MTFQRSFKMDKKQKTTSASYGQEHQEQMKRFHYDTKREGSNNSKRLKLAERLLEKVDGRFQGKAKSDINAVDVGCSVGTFAIEMSKKGYRSVGVDFDDAALEIAEALNLEEGSSATFLNKDVAELSEDIGKIDIALCMDIFEHLHDDELGGLFQGLKRSLSADGCIIFHTLPCEFDYLFWNGKKGIIQFPILLWPFRWFPDRLFSKLVRIYALIIDTGMMLFLNKTYKEHIKTFHHCNPLTLVRMRDIFERAGYTLDLLETGFIDDQYKPSDKKAFQRLSITHRSLYGIASVKR